MWFTSSEPLIVNDFCFLCFYVVVMETVTSLRLFEISDVLLLLWCVLRNALKMFRCLNTESHIPCSEILRWHWLYITLCIFAGSTPLRRFSFFNCLIQLTTPLPCYNVINSLGENSRERSFVKKTFFWRKRGENLVPNDFHLLALILNPLGFQLLFKVCHA